MKEEIGRYLSQKAAFQAAYAKMISAKTLKNWKHAFSYLEKAKASGYKSIPEAFYRLEQEVQGNYWYTKAEKARRGENWSKGKGYYEKAQKYGYGRKSREMAEKYRLQEQKQQQKQAQARKYYGRAELAKKKGEWKLAKKYYMRARDLEYSVSSHTLRKMDRKIEDHRWKQRGFRYLRTRTYCWIYHEYDE